MRQKSNPIVTGYVVSVVMTREDGALQHAVDITGFDEANSAQDAERKTVRRMERQFPDFKVGNVISAPLTVRVEQ